MHGGVDEIKPYVDKFIEFAKSNPKLTFLVTRVGCGIAGFHDKEIAPLFSEAVNISNIFLPESFGKSSIRNDNIVMNKIVAKEYLSERVVKFEVEAPLIAKSRKAGHFVIVRVGKKEKEFHTLLPLLI